MADQELSRILGELVKRQALNRPNFHQVTGLSQSILSGVGVVKPWQSGQQTNAADIRGPSFVNRVLDIMSRPMYGVENAVKGSIERAVQEHNPISALAAANDPGPVFHDIAQGLSGKEKTTGRDIVTLADPENKLPGPLKFIGGMAVDTALDPLTYAGGLGLFGKVGKAAKTSTEALGALEQGTGDAAKTLTEDISRRAAEQAQKLDTEIPKLNMPAPEPGSPPRTFAAGPGPNLPTETPIEPAVPAVRRPIAQIDSGPSPRPVDPLEGLSEGLLGSPAGKTEFMKLSNKLALNSDSLMTLKAIHESIAEAKSPIAKNLLRKEAEKLQAGVKPADILSQARVAPPEFPALTIGQRWIDTANEAAQSFLKSNRLQNINHIGQTNLYNKILNAASKVRKDRRQFTVMQMLRVAEENILQSGRHLTDAEGLSVRLSDVANMSGGPRALTSRLVDDFRKARPSQQVEDLKSFTTPQVASEILDPVIKTGEQIAPALQALPPSQTVMMGSNISKELMKIAQAAGASSREGKTAKAYIDDLFNPVRDKLYSATQQEARNLVRQSASGTVNPDTLSKISKEVYASLDANPKVLGRQLQQQKVVEGIMTKFATWWGAKDLKPFSREYIDTARNVAAAFAETLTPIVQATKPSQRFAAFTVAQGKRLASSPEEQALADQFKYMVERLMGTHGITSNAEAVVLRSGTVMKELNAELPKEMKFFESKGVDDLGRKFDYTDGNWMHSWKEWDVKEPAETLYRLTRSLQMVTRKNSMWDDAAARWGMPIKGSEFQHQVKNVARLKGTYFPQQIAEQIDTLHNQLERDVFKTPNKAIELFDKVQRMWKTGVTIYSPAHHIRNLNGDVYLAALDGVVSPKPYLIATKVLHAYPTRYKDLESVFNIMDPNLRENALRARPGNVVLNTKRGDKLTAEQLYQAAESQGLFIRAMHVEDLTGDAAPAFGTLGPKIQPFGGKVYGAATRASELRDHWVRLAHFTDILSKSNAPLRVAIEQAGRRVRKFHPDGMDMTGFEQNVLRRVIPFYSWMRKATPLVIEGAIMRPHITMAFPKAMANMQYATGIESNGPGDPFPMDQMFPDWLKEKGIGPILGPGSGLGREATWRGSAPGDTIVNPSSPFLDQLQQIGNPKQTILSGLSPSLRIPIELATGNSSLGIPLNSVQGGTPAYLAEQIPSVGLAARLSGLTRSNEPYNPEQLINFLTAMGVTGTGPYQPQAQTEIRQAITQIGNQNRGNYR